MWSIDPPERELVRCERATKLFNHAAAHRRPLLGHKRQVDGLAWNCTGTRLATVGRDGSVCVWSAELPRGVKVDQTSSSSSNEKTASAASAAAGGSTSLSAATLAWAYPNARITHIELKGHTGAIDRCSWNPTHPDQLATCSWDKTVKVWDVRSGGGRCLHTVPTIAGNINVAWSPCGKYIALCNNNNLVSLLQWDADQLRMQVLKSISFNHDVNSLAWERNSSRLLLGHQHGHVEVLVIPSMTLQTPIVAHGNTIFAVSFDPSGKQLATAGADAQLHLWDLHDMVCIKSIQRLEDNIRALSWSHDSQFIAYGGKDHKIEIADVATGNRIILLENGEESMNMSFHPHLHVLAYSTKDRPDRPGQVLLLVATQQALTLRPSTQPTSSASAKPMAPAAVGGRGMHTGRGPPVGMGGRGGIPGTIPNPLLR